MADDNFSRSSYAGRWVARVRGRIIAQGGTPELARRAAKSSRPKENPEIIYMSTSFALPHLLEKIRDILPPEGDLYLVGGAVRDLLLNRLSRDFDFALPSNGIAFGSIISARRGSFITLALTRSRWARDLYTIHVALCHDDLSFRPVQSPNTGRRRTRMWSFALPCCLS